MIQYFKEILSLSFWKEMIDTRHKIERTGGKTEQGSSNIR